MTDNDPSIIGASCKMLSYKLKDNMGFLNFNLSSTSVSTMDFKAQDFVYFWHKSFLPT